MAATKGTLQNPLKRNVYVRTYLRYPEAAPSLPFAADRNMTRRVSAGSQISPMGFNALFICAME